MFMHNKRLRYTARVAEPDPVLASFMFEQSDGAAGKLAAQGSPQGDGNAEDAAEKADAV